MLLIEKSNFICPNCGKELNKDDTKYKCDSNHSFDRAKSGYVNLLLSQNSKQKIHGDAKEMVIARKNFLDKGFYKNLLDELCQAAYKYSKDKSVIVDAGCGECYYCAGIADYFSQNNKKAEIVGFDISKDALSYGAKRIKTSDLAVASIFHMPIKDNFSDIFLSIFAPFAQDEFYRVMKKDSILIRIIPLENHLMKLKSAVYEKPYKNEVSDTEIEGLKFLERINVVSTIKLESNTDIKNLFTMTPYHYKTSVADKLKLDCIDYLEVETEFSILIYRK